ncbi:MAG: protein translocase subunit SecD [Desulforudis sp.]|nr:protein translocase subunit SecD [Clostridia bacterium]RJX20903.1 MAG: protein translocase subunit SecD [Desulforudis sp.]
MRWDNLIKMTAVLLVVGFVGLLTAWSPFSGVPWLPFSKDINLGLDLQGGIHVVLQAVPTEEDKVTADAVKRSIAILENRINQFGVTEPIIQQQGSDRIIVEIAGVDDPDEVVRTLIMPAYLEFKTEDGQTVLTGANLKNAQEALDNAGQAEVNFELDREGSQKFAEVTTANVGRHLAIMLDGEVLQNPTIESPITEGKGRITGYASLEEAHRIAVLLRSGALPVKLDIMEKRTVGPTLGTDSLERSKTAGAVGLGAILVFMLAYYRVPGLVASLSLITYAILVFLIFAAIKVTMTLPGIAGFLLSLGIAIDANIVIFERLKEELRTGRTLRSAIDAGFRRAFVAIVDANVTTILAAIVLYIFAPTMIKGFALTLGIGIAVSMFTALSMTRWLLHQTAGSGLARNPKLYGA